MYFKYVMANLKGFNFFFKEITEIIKHSKTDVHQYFKSHLIPYLRDKISRKLCKKIEKKFLI